MSCFVMNKEPLAALANAVETRLNCDYNYWGFEAPSSLYRELADCKTSCTYFAEPIYRKLYSVNVRAYNGRYAGRPAEPGDEEAPDVDVSRYIVHHRPEYREHGFAALPWHYHLAKLLDCWLYQTLEDATKNDPLRLAMAEFRDGLYHFIIQNSPEYTAVQWGELPAPGAGSEKRYQVVTYDSDGGADDKKEYQTINEAEGAAQGYTNGAGPLSDGLRYEGAIVFDRVEKRVVREYGYFPDFARPVEGKEGAT